MPPSATLHTQACRCAACQPSTRSPTSHATDDELGPGRSRGGLDLNRAMERNLYWAQRLGWNRALPAIGSLLGFRRSSPTLPSLTEAVFRWQSRNGLSADGILGPNTWRTMQRALRGGSPARPRTGPPPAVGSPRAIPLGRLTLKAKSDPTRTVGLYAFTPRDLVTTARMLQGENAGLETIETAGVMWSMLNLYAFVRHYFRAYPTFADLLYKYSSPLFEGKRLRTMPWEQLRPSSRRMAVRGLTGQLPNPVGNATDFANPYIYFKRRFGRRPSYDEWVGYIEEYTKPYLEWIGPVEGLKQYRVNTFYVNKRIRGVPEGVVQVYPPGASARPSRELASTSRGG